MTAQSREEARWDGISEDATREILRQGEIYLDRTLQTAIAADQRATTLMGIYGAVGVALLVAGATLGTSSQPNLPLIVSIVVMAFFIHGILYIDSRADVRSSRKASRFLY